MKFINWCALFGHKFINNSGWCQRNCGARKPLEFNIDAIEYEKLTGEKY